MLQIKSLTQLQLYQQHQVQGNHFIFISKIITIQTIQHNIKILNIPIFNELLNESLNFNTVQISFKLKEAIAYSPYWIKYKTKILQLHEPAKILRECAVKKQNNIKPKYEKLLKLV
ncbi:Hypothetical_protein [Hexamita inflata]|uniref:Hypothetical_protein n=1 Tax=Hexamita inflata TaxID=28002 RepID=A0AA86PZ84_9EUKA|nr:Hypothetical protein HINF_LOCUS34268 [Hexamita inflata]